jgi:hypothetical protein
MENPKMRLKELKANVEKAVEELAHTSSKYPPDSGDVREAKYKRAVEEKALFDFLNAQKDKL